MATLDARLGAEVVVALLGTALTGKANLERFKGSVESVSSSSESTWLPLARGGEAGVVASRLDVLTRATLGGPSRRSAVNLAAIQGLTLG